MKFLNDDDAKLFYVEIGKLDEAVEANKDSEPTDEEKSEFIKRRRESEKTVKDSRKSSDSKSMWREKRYKIMKGIKAYHKSTEGKRFHRKLGRFLATRLTRADESFNERYDALKCINSAKTHIIVELEYFHTLFEQLELDDFYMTSREYFSSIEEKLLYNKPLNFDEFLFIVDITETASVVKAIADKVEIPVDQVEKQWDSIKDELISQGNKESDKNFYGLLVSILKKKLKI